MERTKEGTKQLIDAVHSTYQMAEKLWKYEKFKKPFTKNDLVNETLLGHTQAESALNDMAVYGLVATEMREGEPPLFTLSLNIAVIQVNINERKKHNDNEIDRLTFEKGSYDIMMDEYPKIIIKKG